MKEYSFKRLGYAGRLGNQLWQIAWVYAQAKKNNAKPLVIPNWEYRNVFSLPEAMYGIASEHSIDGGDLYYQELHYWNGYHKDIWKLFQPSNNALNQTYKYIGNNLELLKQNGCSVHYRRGDYLNHPLHFPIPTEKYYLNSMKSVLNNNPDTVFYIFSDNINEIIKEYKDNQFTSKLIDSGKVIFFRGTPRPVEVSDRIDEPKDWLDLFSMALCSNHIIANSTFSWWGAFLSEKNHAYYPSRWFGTHEAVRNIPWQHMMPDNWTMIKC